MTTQELDALERLCDEENPTAAMAIVMLTAVPKLIAEVRRLTAEVTELRRRKSIMHSALIKIVDICDCAWRNIPYWNANHKIKKLTERISRDAYRASIGMEPGEQST